ncbi:hypothetical protein GCM10011581_24080 [Saccharopolyspora subtropica]|uniref:ABC transport system permease protein n=1 Tax=Saccharopolyspora thermophila TaxID=89367 RepID=A0A917NBP0_9PSEU|nr:hypothetical protein GCM10011581_24080 [Saccharopolyspora subtropica]
MSSGSIPVTPQLGAAIALLLVAAAAVAGLGGLARHRDVLLAGLRGAVQLLAVSLLIAHLVRWTALAALFIVLMFAVAAHTAGGASPATAHGGWPGCRSPPGWPRPSDSWWPPAPCR